jgi:hypothetical protein
MEYGTEIERGAYRQRREGFGEVEVSGAGNVIVRVGREISETPGPWEQIAHVVLTPDEWRRLVARVAALKAGDAARRAVS